MSLSTWTENIARFLMVFGLFVVVTMVGVAIFKATVVDDIWANQDTFQDPNDPATTTDAAVLSDVRDVQVLDAWERTMSFLGLGSILAAILATFGIVILRGVKLMRTVFPHFLRAYLGAKTGRDAEFRGPLREVV